MKLDIWHDPDGVWAEFDGQLLGPFATESQAEAAVFRARAQAEGVATKKTPNPRYLPLSVPTLAALLNGAKDAHTAYEAEHGPDEDWPTWYAEYILGVRDA